MTQVHNTYAVMSIVLYRMLIYNYGVVVFRMLIYKYNKVDAEYQEPIVVFYLQTIYQEDGKK